jgi:hypothetical protein
VRHPSLLALFSRHADSKGKQAKLKSPNQLQELLDISRSILQVNSFCLPVRGGGACFTVSKCVCGGGDNRVV